MQVLQQVAQFHLLLVAGLGSLGSLVQLLAHRFKVGQRQLGFYDFDIGGGVHLVGHVLDVFIFEAAHHMGDGIGLADIGQKLVAQALALGGTGHQAGNIHKFHHCRNGSLRLDHFRQLIKARIRHFHYADIGINGTKRIVLRLDTCLGQGIEQGGLADVWQADDAALETHFYNLCKAALNSKPK